MADNFSSPDASRASQQPDPASQAEQSATEKSALAPEAAAEDAQSQDASQHGTESATVEDYSRLPEIDPATAMTPKRRDRLVLASSAAVFIFVIVCALVFLFICSSIGQFQPQP